MADAVLNPLRALVGYQLRRTSTCNMDDLASRLSEIGLRPTTASILVIIGANPLIQPSAVGRELGIQRANVTPLIASLEKDGLVARHPINGRSHGLELTAAGAAAHAKTLQAMWRLDEDMLSGLKPDERLQFTYLLSLVWSGVASAHDPEADPGAEGHEVGPGSTPPP